jgi:hypothetical protein
MKGAPLLRLNVEGPNGRLVLSGASDAESRSWYEFKSGMGCGSLRIDTRCAVPGHPHPRVFAACRVMPLSEHRPSASALRRTLRLNRLPANCRRAWKR